MANLKTSYNNVGGSSAVSSVLYSRGEHSHQETKGGSYVYWGDASNFHEWEFRTRLRLAGKKSDHYVDAISKVVEGLRGDAFLVAQEVGLEQLWSKEAEAVEGSTVGEDDEAASEFIVRSTGGVGIDLLIKAMKNSVFPLTTHEAKELFRQYCLPTGSLSRQTGESMQQYISRRRRCWKLLKELDPEIELSEGHRADMLLDLAGLDKSERIMVQASVNNARNFDKFADALLVQHPRCHVREQRRNTHSSGSYSSMGKGKGGYKSKGFGNGKGKRRFHAHLGVEDEHDHLSYDDQGEGEGEEYDEPYTNPAHESEEDTAYLAGEVEEPPMWEEAADPVFASELNGVAMLAEEFGDDVLDDPAQRAQCAEYIQTHCIGCLAFSNGKAKERAKGKEKGNTRSSLRTFRYRTVATNSRS